MSSVIKYKILIYNIYLIVYTKFIFNQLYYSYMYRNQKYASK